MCTCTSISTLLEMAIVLILFVRLQFSLPTKILVIDYRTPCLHTANVIDVYVQVLLMIDRYVCLGHGVEALPFPTKNTVAKLHVSEKVTIECRHPLAVVLYKYSCVALLSSFSSLI